MFNKFLNKNTPIKNYLFEGVSFFKLNSNGRELISTELIPTKLSFHPDTVYVHRGDDLKKLLESRGILTFLKYHEIYHNPTITYEVLNKVTHQNQDRYLCRRSDSPDRYTFIVSPPDHLAHPNSVALLYDYDFEQKKYGAVLEYEEKI